MSSTKDKYNKYHTYKGKVKFYLKEHIPDEDECKIIFSKILEQATLDLIKLKNPITVLEKESYWTASGLLFSDDYSMRWGDEEVVADHVYDVLKLDKQWIREGLRKRLDKRKKTVNKKIKEAVDLAAKYGPDDGEHHKTWVIHQMVQILCDFTDEQLTEWSLKSDFEDEGIPP